MRSRALGPSFYVMMLVITSHLSGKILGYSHKKIDFKVYVVLESYDKQNLIILHSSVILSYTISAF